MRRRASDEFQLAFAFDADPAVPVVVEPAGGDYVTQARARRVSPDDVAPTILQNNRGTAQILIEPDVAVTPDDRAKPPYRIPSMGEIAAVSATGLTVVSTFSGCGGSCLGFKMAGYRVLWANEFVSAAQATYRANHPWTHLDVADIRTVTAESIRRVIGDVDVDVLEGSPPCASFSMAGKREQHWGTVRKYSDVAQRTDDLFGEFVRIVDGLRPRAFVAENVAGITRGVARGFFQEYLRLFRALPYHVEARLLDAQHLGVPQRRVRMIVIGVRRDVGRPAWPRKLPYRYSVRDAIPWIARQGDNGGFGGGAMVDATGPSPTIGASDQTGNGRFPASLVEARIVGGNSAVGSAKGADVSIDAACPTVIAGHHRSGPHQFVVETRKVALHDVVDAHVAPTLDGYAVGDAWDELKPGESSDRFFSLVRVDADAPCETVTSGAGAGAPGGVASVAHPFERRKFSIAELRRICGFPDDFVLTGTYAQQWERLGRAVPPPMMRAVAEALLPVLRRG